GSRFPPFASLRLLALQGRKAETSALIAGTVGHATAGGDRLAAIHAPWAAAGQYNGPARYHEAVSAAPQATSNPFESWVWMWGLPELIEAAARAGDTELAREALKRLEETTLAGTELALGIQARSRALVTSGDSADLLYREAIERLGRTEVRP